MTLTVHHLQVSQSERIPWLCEELSIPYDLKIYKRSPLLSPPELKALTPLGAAPVINDTLPPYSPEKPLVLPESAACIEYIVQKHGHGRLMLPPSHPDYATYLYWWHFSNDNLQPLLSQLMGLRGVDPKREDARHKRLLEKYRVVLGVMDEQLAEANGGYLAGKEFTVADVMSHFSLSTMRIFAQLGLDGFPNVLAWLKRCADRDGYKRARAKADPDTEPTLEEGVPEGFEG